MRGEGATDNLQKISQWSAKHLSARCDVDPMNRENANPFTVLEERLRFETLLADLSSKFVNLPAGEVDRESMNAQRRICEFLDCYLLVLWQLSDDAAGFLSPTHPYSAEQEPQPAVRLHEDDYPWFKQQLMAGRIVGFASLDELPEEAARDRESFRQLGKQRQRVPWRVPNVGAGDQSKASHSPRAS
jgi:hypothetical protein